ncbi:MAG TPA: thiamine phosphate synthase, partial [Methylococcales bacterium]
AFTSSTKPHLQIAGTEYIKIASEITQREGVPHVAIGGITLENVEKVLAAGAKAIAVSSALIHAGDTAQVCGAFKLKVTTYQRDMANKE